MESSLRSRKRKQSPSIFDQLDGIFTRSRSQIYVHKNRSGQARPDCHQKREVINLLKRSRKSVVKLEDSEADDGQVNSQSSVKDLRARRVFSHASVTNDDASIGDDVDLKGRYEVIADLEVLHSVKTTQDDVSVDVDGSKKVDRNPNVLLSDSDLGFLNSVDSSIFDSAKENNDCKKIDRSNSGVSDSVNEDLKGESEIIVDLGVLDSVMMKEVDEFVDDYKKNDGNPKVLLSDTDTILGDLDSVDSIIFDSVRENNDCKNTDKSNSGVLDSVNNDFKAESEVIADLRSSNDVVQMTPTVAESVSVVNEIVDSKGFMSKSQSSVSSLRGRKKVFKTPSSFSYRRMLPLLSNANNDLLNFEIVDAKLPEQVPKTNYKASNMNVAVSDCIDDTFDDFVLTTPPDSDIYSQSKIDKALGVTMKPTLKPALNSCSRMKVLQTPTSFSHRRLLPYLMSVSGDNSSTLKSNPSLKLEKVTEQNQSLNVSMNESKTDNNSEKPTTDDEKSDSPTSTLIPVDKSFDIIKTITSVSSDSNLDASGHDADHNGSSSQLEVDLQAEKAVKSDSFIITEQLLPKNYLKSVEEAVSKPTEQSNDANDDKERQLQSSLQITPVNALGMNSKNIKSGILKRTPRGCRGICNCLNCTSFRLHAEKSFEFSRNQMYDAEEIALELINDLSSLRTILDKTASDCNSLDTKQIKEACEKALDKEVAAKERLAQMNEDLSIHCRSMKLSRPNVTFANKTEERVISKDHVF